MSGAGSAREQLAQAEQQCRATMERAFDLIQSREPIVSRTAPRGRERKEREEVEVESALETVGACVCVCVCVCVYLCVCVCVCVCAY